MTVKEKIAYHASTSPLTHFVMDKSSKTVRFHLELPDAFNRQRMF